MSFLINPFVFGGPPLTNISGLSGAWSMSRDLVAAFAGTPRYTDVGGFVSVLADQSGNGRDFAGGVGARPAVTTAGPNSIACAGFDGSNDYLNTGAVPLSSFMSNSAGWMICSLVPDTITPNNANAYDNAPVMGESGGFWGMYLKNTAGTPKTAQALNYPDVQPSAVITAGTPYVFEIWITGGTSLFACVNNGTPISGATGVIGAMTGILGLGHAYTGSAEYGDINVFEAATASAVPASRAAIAADFMAQCGAV